MLNLLALLPFRLEYMSWWVALLIVLALWAFVVLLGRRSLTGMDATRKWVAIGLRMLVMLVLVLILAGLRYQRIHRNLEVWVLRDVSGSTTLVEKKDYPGKSLDDSVKDYLTQVSKDPRKKADDTLGIISFQEDAQVDLVPSSMIDFAQRGEREHGSGTNLSRAIELALASMSPDAMHRFVLIHDGNSTAGLTDNAIAAAASQHVPIDVMPLRYDVTNAVTIDRFVAPTWKRENEPFGIDIILRSTASVPVTGKLEVIHKTSDKDDVLVHAKPITLQPGPNVDHENVPPLASVGVHRFVATFTPDPGSGGAVISSNLDKILKPASAITFVRGHAQVLFIDNYGLVNGRPASERFQQALSRMTVKGAAGKTASITVKTIPVSQFPDVIELQNYDAVILGNVPRGEGGLSLDADKALARYAHDLGGGVVMIGGDQTFGAGGWQGSELEKVLPVSMDIPAERQVGKGALVLVMHSCEFPDGNYWGLQCALQSIKTLSDRDEIGIISYGWGGGPNGNGIGGAQWDFPLQEKGSGAAVVAAANKMQLGDMPDFDDTLTLALNGVNGGPGLAKSNARHKHVIIISDGDPQPPKPNPRPPSSLSLIQQYQAAKVSISTVTVYPHGGGGQLPPVMDSLPKDTGGHSYGPINEKPSQLPQIFIKEATIVRRTLINEDDNGIAVTLTDASDPAAAAFRGLQPPPVNGMILTTKKPDPQVDLAMTAGPKADPILADWQAGLGKTLVFTADPTAKWGASWEASGAYDAFWQDVVRAVHRPPMSNDFDVQTTVEGGVGKITVEALNKDDSFQNFLNIRGEVIGPNPASIPVQLVQTGPGTYEATFPAADAGSYAVSLNYHGQGQNGYLRGGVAVNTDPEFADLQSNDVKLQEIAQKTGGRMLGAWDAPDADLFSRENLAQTASPLPVWDILIPILLGLILLDVAARRIAWDWRSIRKTAVAGAAYVRSFTHVRKVETRGTLDALRRVREETTESKPRGPGLTAPPTTAAPQPPAQRPDPRAKFQAKAGVEGDISQVVGGATDKPIPSAPTKIDPKGAPAGGYTGSLLEAKRRAQQQIKKKEEEGK